MSKITPGIHKTIDLKYINLEEANIIKKLAAVWFITYVKGVSFKGSNFIYALAKPTTSLTEKYRLDSEVLVLFTPYFDFDRRTFDFVDKTMVEYQNRLDKLCIILISKDEDIKKKIRQIAEKDKEARLVIPFSYDDLQSKNISFIDNALKEVFYGRDLFDFESPLRNDTYFFPLNTEFLR